MNVLARAISSHERNGLDILMFGNMLDCFKSTLADLKDSFRQINLFYVVGNQTKCSRDPFRGFHNHGVAKCYGEREHP